MSVEYVTAGSEALDEVVALTHAEYGGDLAEWRARVARSLTRERCVLVLAQRTGDTIGFGKADVRRATQPDEAAPSGHYLTGLVVLPAWRQRGIGLELTRRRVESIWSTGQPAWCFTNAENTASLALHARLGFVETARGPRFHGESFAAGSASSCAPTRRLARLRLSGWCGGSASPPAGRTRR